MNLRRLPFIFACGLAVAMFVDGFLRMEIGFDRFATAYYFLALLLCLGCSADLRAPRGVLTLIALCAANYCFNPLLVAQNNFSQALALNLQFLLRTVGVFFAAFVYFYNSPMSVRSYRWFFGIQLSVIFVALVADYIFGFGDTLNGRGEVRQIVASFFWSGNSTAFLAAMSVVGLIFFGGTPRLPYIILVMAQAAAISVLMDSKALFLAIGVTLGFYFFPFLYRGTRTKFFVLLASAAAMVVVVPNLGAIADFVLPMYSALSADSGRTTFMAQNYGALAALSSMRVDGFLLVWNEFVSGSAGQIVFGRSFYDLIYLEMLVEIDLMDILYSGGLVALTLLLVALFGLFRLAHARERLLSQLGLSTYFHVSLILAVLFATVSGHVFLHPTSMTVLGMMVGAVFRSVKLGQAYKLREMREIAVG